MNSTTDSSGDTQGTLAGAGGALIGGGLTELQTNTTFGFLVILLGVGLVVLRAYWRWKATGQPPQLR